MICETQLRVLRLPTGNSQAGLTLVELAVVVAVLAILVGIGIPSYQSVMMQNRAASAANEVQSALQFARSTAVARSRDVTVCASTDGEACSNSNDWATGWIVVDNTVNPAEVLREVPALHASVTLTGGQQWVFRNTGTLEGQAIVHFDLDVDSGTATRRICLTLSGTSRIIEGGGTC